MLHVIILAALLGVLIMLIVLTFQYRSAIGLNGQALFADEDKSETAKGFLYTAIVLVVVLMLLFVYLAAKGTPWEGHLLEWLNIVVRVMHITFGIAWIGASFYFVFLENALNRTDGLRDELAGNLWAVHGGGFYYLEKYKTAPKVLPKNLHWFKYEAYFTWLSGFCLLFVVYYFNAKAFLIDDNVMKLSVPAAIAIGIGSFGVAWLLYDVLCRTALIRNGVLFAVAGFIIAAAFALFYANVFSGRAAYMHFGAMLGTLMAANVFFVIIPAQKEMVLAAKLGKVPEAAAGKHAGLRSLHNNYLTLPVLFVMVSNHFPSTFGFKYSWLVLAGITLATAGIKHYLNLREKGDYSMWVMPVSVLVLLGTAFITAPKPANTKCDEAISFTRTYAIIQARCVQCHSAKPTDESLTAPPNGVLFDNAQTIVNLKDKILQRVVLTKTMPQNNKTAMTEEEREIIRCWIEQGASTK